MLILVRLLTCPCSHHKPGDHHHPQPHLEGLELLPKEGIPVKGSNKSIEDIPTTEESTAEQSYRTHCLDPEYDVLFKGPVVCYITCQ